jgi:hypothetical protein
MFVCLGNARAFVWLNFISAGVAFLLALADPRQTFMWIAAAAAFLCGLLSLAWTCRRPPDPDAAEVERLKEALCPLCGHDNQAGWRYCSRCGHQRST